MLSGLSITFKIFYLFYISFHSIFYQPGFSHPIFCLSFASLHSFNSTFAKCFIVPLAFSRTTPCSQLSMHFFFSTLHVLVISSASLPLTDISISRPLYLPLKQECLQIIISVFGFHMWVNFYHCKISRDLIFQLL